MPKLARADRVTGALRTLNDELHELHARAGWPSLGDITTALSRDPDSSPVARSTVYRVFTADELPNPRVLLGIVRYLAGLCWRADEDAECDRFDGLWRAVLQEVVPEPGLRIGPLPALAGPSGASGTGDEPDDGPGGGRVPVPLGPVIGPPSAPDRAGGRVAVDREASRALIIGAESYTNLPALPGTAEAVQRMARVLADHDNGYFTPEHTDALVNPTAAAVRRALVDAAGSTTDTLLVHFSGHGITDRHGELHLLLSDAGDDGDPAAGLVPYSEIQYVLSQTRARNVILLLDTCYAGQALEWPTDGRTRRIAELAVRHRSQVVKARSTPTATVVMASATDATRPHAFTSALLDALATRPSEGVLALDELHERVQHTLKGGHGELAVSWHRT
jgi:hypothetical protein